jgi:hypothetical protein
MAHQNLPHQKKARKRKPKIKPILFCSFLLFINDLLLHIQEAKLVSSVDDTNLLITGKDECVLQHKITKVMTLVETWFQKNNHKHWENNSNVISL